MTDITTYLNTTTAIGILSRFDNPEMRAQLGVFLKVGMALRIVKHFFELVEFFVCDALLDVVRQWQVVEGVNTQGFIVDLHVIVNSLLIGEMEVVLSMIRCNHIV